MSARRALITATNGVITVVMKLALLVTIALAVACGGKKPATSTTSSQTDMKGMGGNAYGGNAYGGNAYGGNKYGGQNR